MASPNDIHPQGVLEELRIVVLLAFGHGIPNVRIALVPIQAS